MSFDIDDSSYLWGDGLFETMQVLDGRLVALTRHMARLNRSLVAFDYPLRSVHVEGHLEPGGLEDGLLRVTVSRSGRITTRWRERRGSSGVRAMVMKGWYDPANVLDEHKTTSYLKNLEMKRRAKLAGFDDAIGISTDGRVGEASMANLFMWIDGEMITPSIDGVLPGITRERILEAALSRDEPVVERPIGIGELVGADAVVLTSSGVGAAPLLELDEIPFDGSEAWARELNEWLVGVE